MRHVQIIGVDVSESSIKVLQLNADNTVRAYGSASLVHGVVEKGRIIDAEAFSVALNNILKDTKPNSLLAEDGILKAVVCLPESKLFSHHCVIPDTVLKEDLEAYICTEAQKIIPFALDTLYWNYHVVEEQGVRNATFVSIAKTDLENYVKAFTNAKVRPAFVGGELFALGQSLLPNPPFEEDYIILDIGAHSTNIGFFSIDAVPNVSILVPQGGEYFTQYLIERLKILPEEAEQMKRQYGVNMAHDATQVPVLLRECLLPIIEKINEAKIYFEQKTGKPVTHLIIAGGSALLPQIDVVISEKLGIDVRVANPLVKIEGHELFGDGTPSIFFANVIGLALCAKKADFTDINLLTQYRDDENVIEEESLALQDIRSFSDFQYVFNTFIRSMKVLVATKPNFLKQSILAIKGHIHMKLFATMFFVLGACAFLVWVVINYL